MTRPKVTIYTDGGADPNPGYGGWAALLKSGKHEKVLTGSAENATNNQMELTAAINALEALKSPCEVELYTDSQYLQKGITEWIEDWVSKGWKKKGERVDQLAREARLEIAPEAGFDAALPRLYTRGSCKGNPGPGGWGVVLEQGGDTSQFSGTMLDTTNNRMELVAVLEGLATVPARVPIYIVTTSDYVFQGATKWIHGWRRRDWKKKDGQPVANSDLWLELDKELQSREIRWINGKNSPERFAQGLEEAARIAQLALEHV
jgi:ribonuclease HI